ncbi:MAG: adenylate kinase [Flavobacteriales bacterium]|jgi:adenylate kinase|nr:adenylate kinase [Flavobacteriales bacterium]|tara:strand:- start:986 stop:1567 length:582 start_codon:yes stop_codon:yes gene_type:complete
MLNIVLFGPPGSGKGTQADLIVQKKQLTHISTGDVFRKNISQQTNLGKLAENYIQKGQLVPDDLTINLLANELDSYSDSNGYIFDGFPRTLPQAQAFSKLLEKKEMNLSFIISLEVSENELVKRLLNRGLDSGRADDKNQEVIRNRIQVYHNQTAMLKNFYLNKLKDSFFSIDGERTVNEISEDIFNIFLRKK